MAPLSASAIGFGEVSLHAKMGESFNAEIPIVAIGNENIETACFSVVPGRSADLPYVTNARPRLIKRGQAYYLQVVSSKPIRDPILLLGIRAGCGFDIEREYVLVPDPPISSAATEWDSMPPVRATRQNRETRNGDTLAELAQNWAPGNKRVQRKLLAQLLEEHPGIGADDPLPEGMDIKRPMRRAERRNSEQSDLVASAPVPRAAAKKQTPRPVPLSDSQNLTVDKALRPAKDRLVLSAGPEIDPAGRMPSPSRTPSEAETEERLLKMETTLRLLTQEVEKMDQAIDLAAKAIEAQNRLNAAQAPERPPIPSVASHQPAGPSPSNSHWFELLVSACVGAGASFGMAQWLGRRRRFPGEQELPLSFAGYRPEVVPATPAPSQPPAAQFPATPATSMVTVPGAPLTNPTSAKAAPLDYNLRIPAGEELVEGCPSDEGSVLALAEIMIAFGKTQGAVDTLAEHIEQNLPTNIEPWRMLLDLYRRGGMRYEYTALAAEISARFNAKAPTWTESSEPISGLHNLEEFPHVIQKSCQLWGTQAGVDYLYSLVHDTRTGQRSGFPLEVVEEIALLIKIQEDAYGLRRPA